MAARQAGVLPMSCDVCQSAPEFRKVWGCDSPADEPVWIYEDEEYYSCPLNFVSDEVADWYNEYMYNTRFQGAADRYGDNSNLYIEAMMYYDYWHSKFTEEKRRMTKGT